ncbi:Cthe_2314 family HEPN domain-containing protein [Paenibacillus abyssi]|uniref:Cthe-2314-like HEPN domain-containing protein n=1 Tax=Paenibacillus abyssi TaxID=1340531 RepID=A0A917CU03_9BACL|nr:Cthe_2314 family HEPN domain-containing protein [Paenibacillus abyssi]GGF96819.1 hypothetical protein GCM10010916_12570 [Paenibacillus abyssi]
MLRMLFNEPPRIAQGRLAEALQAMERFVSLLQRQISEGLDGDIKLRKYEIWTLGLIGSLDELEQSQYAAHRYAEQIKSTYLINLSEAELMSYSRHIYYDKNAFIRIFALLDKLGTLMNEMFKLETGRIKAHFSYFTVLRNMRGRSLHMELTLALNEIKERNKEPMARLRKRRNTEIHYMNSEMHDDLQRLHIKTDKDVPLENIGLQLADLDKGCEMVMDTLRLTFEYAHRMMRKTK